MQQLTDEQFARALNLSTICTNNGWQFTTEIIIAKMIATAVDKETVITKIENIINAKTEQEFLDKLATINKN